MRKLCFILVLLCFVSKAYCFPALTGRVVDEANILTSQQKYQLEQTLKQAEPRQVVAVSLSSLEGQEIEEYGYQLGRHWGIGRKDINDGVLVLIAPNQRRLRIEVGYGLEHILTDAQCDLIVRHIMLPLARQGQYDRALIQGSWAVIKILAGEPVSFPKQSSSHSNNALESILANTSMICIFLCGIMALSLKFVHKKFKDYKTNSFHNRLLFFYENVFLLNITCLGMTLITLTLAETESMAWLIFAVCVYILCGINLNNIKAWRKNPKFPYKKLYTTGYRSFGGGDNGDSWGGGSSGGGSSFSGGGGSFGGGGASGSW